MQNKILLIEDELAICDILSYALSKEGFTVRYALCGEEGIKCIEEFNPHLIILDLMLPDTSGFDICKRVTLDYKIPIIMLTARNDIVDKVLGLELGADDFITKPFDVREVVARVKAALRRKQRLQEIINEIEFNKSKLNVIKISGDIEINIESRSIFKSSEEIKLKPREYDLLLILAENKGRVFSREQLLDMVWNMDFDGDFRTVDVHVQRLRKKLDYGSNSIIETVFGVGYKMR
ncbi:MAG: response regulator transcription factor [Clostridiaceae bacterium]|nr:response regulator transcription factor [Clostridiaceae bacterium]